MSIWLICWSHHCYPLPRLIPFQKARSYHRTLPMNEVIENQNCFIGKRYIIVCVCVCRAPLSIEFKISILLMCTRWRNKRYAFDSSEHCLFGWFPTTSHPHAFFSLSLLLFHFVIWFDSIQFDLIQFRFNFVFVFNMTVYTWVRDIWRYCDFRLGK